MNYTFNFDYLDRKYAPQGTGSSAPAAAGSSKKISNPTVKLFLTNTY